MCVCICIRVMAHIWKSEHNFRSGGVGPLLHPKIEFRSSDLAAETLTIEPPHQLSLELVNAFRYGVTSLCPFSLGVSWDASDHKTAP